MKYQWIFFDADETLFSFNAFAGLQKLFADNGLKFNEQDFTQYEKVNKPLWVKYQNAEISAEQIQTIRFEPWEQKLGKSAVEINQDYMLALADLCKRNHSHPGKTGKTGNYYKRLYRLATSSSAKNRFSTIFPVYYYFARTRHSQTGRPNLRA
ncbi:unknown [[Mannheimia] succiniciproducens MBEL55E]|uniref:5'-nucleotidase n=1 Tax=Mannheimia succiniciproducens (strain KCTC 0769BP / MBEL55E) TaxID=221988 RepID=Q65R98_MANSM|nr:unknown [[Mannheimia] succiniciproducens MBEL55E]